jgi:hypothetical protein
MTVPVKEMADTGSCEVKRIQMNSAAATMDQARQGRDEARRDYLTCMGPQAQGDAAEQDAADTIRRLVSESEELFRMNETVLQMLNRETQNQQAIGGVSEIAQEKASDMKAEIDQLKTAIRTQKRKFLDASPSKSPAVAGMYYTKTPDNQALIAFLVAFGVFLVLISVLIMFNMIPVAYFLGMTENDRFKLVGIIWAVSLIAGYAGFYLFT